MPWNAKKVAAQKVNVSEEQFFVAEPLNNPNVVVPCQVSVAFRDPADAPSTGPLEKALINVYGTLDDAGDDGWDVQPLAGLSFILSQDDDPNRMTFTVSGVPRFRVGVRPERPGAVLHTADFSYRVGTP